MQTLADFSVPNDGEIALCELDGRTQCVNYEYTNVNTFTTSTESHPKIHITRESLHHTGLGDEGKALFLPTNTPFLKQLTQIYSEQGLVPALRTAASSEQYFVSKVALLSLGIYRHLRKLQQIVNPNYLLNDVELILSYSQTRNWANNSIRCLSWHPHSSRIAIATSDDSVRIYSNDNSFVPLLKCKEQKNISCLAWRPKSFTEIAVGHENGIIIWNVDFSALVARPSISNAVVLRKPEHSPVMSIVWNPWGDILVSCAACDSKIYVWDVELDRTSLLTGWDSGNTLLRWSPDNKKLLSVSNGTVFRIWDCQKWTSDRWTVLQGRVQAACWTSCGTNLLFSTNTEPIIYGLTVKNDQIFTQNQSPSTNHAVQLFNVSNIDIEGVAVGGIIQSMETDPTGKHLAVFFKDTNCVCLFNVIKSATLRLIPSSLINGLAAEVPSTIAFQQNFKSGACLTIGWSSGRIQYFPIVYTDLNDLNASRGCI